EQAEAVKLAAKAASKSLAVAGKYYEALAADKGLGLGGMPTNENVRAWLNDPQAAPLPIENQLDELDTVGGAVTKGLLSIVRQAPTIAAAALAAPIIGPVATPLFF